LFRNFEITEKNSKNEFSKFRIDIVGIFGIYIEFGVLQLQNTNYLFS